MRNFIITGKKQSGKSFIVNKLIEEFNKHICGFKTLPFYISDKRRGFYFHSLIEDENYINDIPITINHKENDCIPITATFKCLGVPCLERCLTNNQKIVVMDELGKVEKDELVYINLANRILDSNKAVIGVLRKENIYYINNILVRKDIYVYDLDEISQNYILNDIKEKIGGLLNV